MNTKLVTSCLLAGALLLPMAGYGADNGQTDPGYIEPWLMPPHTADRGQTDPGYIAPGLAEISSKIPYSGQPVSDNTPTTVGAVRTAAYR